MFVALSHYIMPLIADAFLENSVLCIKNSLEKEVTQLFRSNDAHKNV